MVQRDLHGCGHNSPGRTWTTHSFILIFMSQGVSQWPATSESGLCKTERWILYMRTLENAVVVITGGSRGLGHAIAEELGFSGAKIVVDYVHSKEAAEELVAKLRAGGSPDAVAIQADVSDPEQATTLIQETIKRFGRIDVLVNNAGINVDRSLKNMSVQDWRKVIETDLSSYFYTIKAALPFFTQQRSGTIVNMS